MIVGVAAKVVPTLNGVDLRSLAALWLPFLLINAGCTLRVVGQTLTDLNPASFPFAGVSGLLEVTGLAVWGAHLWLIMAGRRQSRRWGRPSDGKFTTLRPGSPIVATNCVGEVLDHDPDLLDTFLTFGFKPLAIPLLRKTLARRVSIAQACRQLGVDTPELVAALNAAREKHTDRRYALPVLTAP
jgi:hypothetical protein